MFREKPGVVIHWRRNVNCGFKHWKNREFQKTAGKKKKKTLVGFQHGQSAGQLQSDKLKMGF